ncbi:hypothetical protein CPB84DRAFT_1750855 [Gymnopilus junonius]|uniref:Uncharacterized protein n=1 Tax=Gymnopilus junonius TaxID=109634 RepID=A0A9P5TIS7_GYMJU|nr:hypothetical protein CPB84DRAFT_1750855 [Gymnopilus junonius]
MALGTLDVTVCGEYGKIEPRRKASAIVKGRVWGKDGRNTRKKESRREPDLFYTMPATANRMSCAVAKGKRGVVVALDSFKSSWRKEVNEVRVLLIVLTNPVLVRDPSARCGNQIHQQKVLLIVQMNTKGSLMLWRRSENVQGSGLESTTGCVEVELQRFNRRVQWSDPPCQNWRGNGSIEEKEKSLAAVWSLCVHGTKRSVCLVLGNGGVHAPVKSRQLDTRSSCHHQKRGPFTPLIPAVYFKPQEPEFSTLRNLEMICDRLQGSNGPQLHMGGGFHPCNMVKQLCRPIYGIKVKALKIGSIYMESTPSGAEKGIGV